ncbi:MULTISPECIES: 4Fe-4S dicluster domain-containing protein [Geobacter]|uniref:4Fe-4S ferredoxin n=2 Tax=Geobacter TaxID=28231 RepID=A0A0C1TS52_9BACT|nr:MULTISPECIES: 4Fe-4S dicluster domain-containing protein [Geobacter]ANA41500.1 4Fe-4S ferredoxin [Geobacter anodireducens]KIE43694.1 4Fe-4S ferredoxin [Geobacter soli]MBE2889219.1 4Fe-4S dicluster domain-containing protein [Geobacter anodireducens]HMN01674.1 4Fe-4S dicluster domain-containing protein [Geobacter anodireducens]
MNRREFLRRSMVVVAGLAAPAAVLELVDPERLLAARPELRWAFLVDTYKCVGCGFCVKACKVENDIPYEANVTRTWVERYVVKRDGEVLIDSPRGARDGFTDRRIEVGTGKLRDVGDEDVEKAFFVPKLCNQCDNPPCVQVCPVGATYKTADGVVLVDRSWCIGCGYCIMGCPYGVRFFHPVYKVAEKCTFCYHRISRGMTSACVDACPFGARRIGNLRDPNDPITRTIMTGRVGILKEEYGTKPQVYYVGLSREVR